MKKLLKAALILGLAAIVSSCGTREILSGGRTSLNEGWKFALTSGDASSEDFDDSAWRSVNLPHDWGVEGEFLQSNPGETGKLTWWGEGWYRKGIELSEDDLMKDISIEFEGVMSGAEVWCNGVNLGGRPYGYSSFSVLLGDAARVGRNLIAVHIDNKPNSSRWYPGGGIYRPVWLRKSPKVGIAEDGVAVTIDSISSGKVYVRAAITLKNRTSGTPQASVSAILGNKMSMTQVDSVRGGETIIQQLVVPKAQLWSPENPALYAFVGMVTTVGGSDARMFNIGLRTAEFRPDGFYLNGEKTFLRGVCVHHDGGAVGAVWNESLWRSRLGQLKEMGCNAIRMTHNPPAPGLLDLCDEMGFLVIDEFTDTWTCPKKPNGYASLFDEWAETDLAGMIRRDRNHPSVIAWSIGNECGEQGYPDKWDIPARLSEICHREDPTRPTTSGNDNPWGAFQPYHETVDVYGFNYKPHLYAQFHEAFPEQPVYGSETASTISTRGFYKFPVEQEQSGGQADFQMSSYDLYAPWWASCPDYEWRYEDACPFLAGEFVWTGFDYLGEPTPYNFDPSVLTNFHDEESLEKARAELEELSRNAPPSRSSYFGIFDLAGFPKDRFWLYQARWRPDLPMAHILPHWSWSGREGETTPVHVYTSGDSGELFVNGVSQGRREKAPGEYRLVWDDVVYSPGSVEVVVYKGGAEWARDCVRTAGEAVGVSLSIRPVPEAVVSLRECPTREWVIVEASLLDASGVEVPDADNLLKFSVEGPAKIIATDAGDPTSHSPFFLTSIRAFHGKAMAIIEPLPQKGRITLKVEMDGGETKFLSIR